VCFLTLKMMASLGPLFTYRLAKNILYPCRNFFLLLWQLLIGHLNIFKHSEVPSMIEMATILLNIFLIQFTKNRWCVRLHAYRTQNNSCAAHGTFRYFELWEPRGSGRWHIFDIVLGPWRPRFVCCLILLTSLISMSFRFCQVKHNF
jgi:hypothetical protein